MPCVTSLFDQMNNEYPMEAWKCLKFIESQCFRRRVLVELVKWNRSKNAFCLVPATHFFEERPSKLGQYVPFDQAEL